MRSFRSALAALAVLLTGLAAALPAAGHNMPYALATLRMSSDGACRLPELGITLLRVEGGAAQALSPAQTSAPISVRGPTPTFGQTLGQYVVLGFEHILPTGLDHVLFIVAIFLLAPRPEPLAWQVTGFTAAHSIALALAVFGVVQISPRVVEVVIAVSIAVMALDNLCSRQPSPWRPLTVMGFGLLHGLGFANVLRDLGLPRGQEALALVGFNLGIEAGQLMILSLAFAAVGWAIPRPWFRAGITIPASIALILVSSLWTIERPLAQT